uniref:Cytochrome c oxidase subunit 2 n=1 Tax=Monoblepharella sp. JEL15 TaxID=224130 RepID=Q85MC4_9FUNG|nr:cytochrome c oxidase subunit 2 [Monoblepharella sp. JEL15]AAO64958.1 cytochrome c oxidase subunit 2 [Monoblepharella sp. JEL15]
MHISIYCDAPEAWNLSFQDVASPTMYGLLELHDHVLFYLILILITVSWLLTRGVVGSQTIAYARHYHGHVIEFLWTLAPALILGAIALPSFRLLYLMDEIIEPQVTVKAIGNQWYWSYEYTDYAEPITFDSFLVDGPLRQLNVDNYLVLPVDTSIRLLITASDVIHSFAVPSLGVKMDAIPGRLNSVGMIISRPGVFYGQCSELCGYLHGFMPIGIKAVSTENYLNWLSTL